MKRITKKSAIIIAVIAIVVISGSVAASIYFGGGSGSAVNLNKGLVGHWKLDGDAKDSTSYSNHGTVTGATSTTDRKGQSSKAYSFDGNDYIDCGSSANFNITITPITLSAWIKITSTANINYRVVSKGSADTNYGYAIFYNPSLDRLDIGDAAGVLRKTGLNLNNGQWHNITWTFNGTLDSSGYKMYVDGSDPSPSAEGTLNGFSSTLQPLIIGGDSDDSVVGMLFPGSVDDVRIYNRALTQAEITALYDSYNPQISVSSLQKGLVGNWKFNGDAKDSTSYSNHGTVTGATSTTDRKGQSNKAYSFDGIDDYIQLADSQQTRMTTGGTISAWIYPKTIGENNGGRIIDKGESVNSTNGYALRIISNNILTFNINGGASLSSPINGITLNTWQHVVATFNSSGRHLYVNGVDVTSTGGTETALPPDVAGVVVIGNRASATDRTFDGYIDDVRLYNRVLTQDEITRLYDSYNSQISVSSLQKGLVGNWKFNGDVKDSTSYSNHGTVTGATTTTDRKGQANKAYSFNGTTDYIELADSQQLRMTTGGTISAWIYPKTVGENNYGRIIDKSISTATVNGYAFYVAINNQLGFTVPGAGLADTFSVNNAITLNTWQHAVVTFNASGRHLYVNGVDVTNTGGTISYLPPDVAGVVHIGNTAFDTIRTFNGYIDDVRLYNRVLTQTEIAALYNEY